MTKEKCVYMNDIRKFPEIPISNFKIGVENHILWIEFKMARSSELQDNYYFNSLLNNWYAVDYPGLKRGDDDSVRDNNKIVCCERNVCWINLIIISC